MGTYASRHREPHQRGAFKAPELGATTWAFAPRRGGAVRSVETVLRAVGTGAGDGTRTRYLNLGKVALCQVSYSRSANTRF
jgi:hypothetical protein